MLSEILFDVPIREVTKEILEHYFQSEKKENDKLEFKSYKDVQGNANSTKRERDKEKIHDIIKTICGFLNSDGGILIWGAPEGKKPPGSNEKVYKGALTPVSYLLETDQIINRISDELSPTPMRVLFQAIELASGEFCYLFEVSKSDYSPHQYKGTYYMRVDGATRPAPHHYVEALIKKITFPRIECFISLGEMKTWRDHVGIPLQITIHNVSKWVNEKNLYYQLIVVGGDVLSLSADDFELAQLKGEYEETIKVGDTLHYMRPFYQHYVLITKRFLGGGSFKVDILLSVWGELSPAISSHYVLSLYSDPADYNTRYLIKEQQENVYLMDLKRESTTEKERIQKTNNMALKALEGNIYEQKLYKYMFNKSR